MPSWRHHEKKNQLRGHTVDSQRPPSEHLGRKAVAVRQDIGLTAGALGLGHENGGCLWPWSWYHKEAPDEPLPHLGASICARGARCPLKLSWCHPEHHIHVPCSLPALKLGHRSNAVGNVLQVHLLGFGKLHHEVQILDRFGYISKLGTQIMW